jgi:hypothetical protein
VDKSKENQENDGTIVKQETTLDKSKKNQENNAEATQENKHINHNQKTVVDNGKDKSETVTGSKQKILMCNIEKPEPKEDAVSSKKDKVPVYTEVKGLPNSTVTCSQKTDSNFNLSTHSSGSNINIPNSNFNSSIPNSNFNSSIPNSNFNSSIPNSDFNSSTPNSGFNSSIPDSNLNSNIIDSGSHSRGHSSGRVLLIKSSITSTQANSELQTPDIAKAIGLTDLQPHIKGKKLQASIINSPSKKDSFLIGFAGTLLIILAVRSVKK